MEDVIKAAKPLIADANKEFFVILYLSIIGQEVYRTIYMLMGCGTKLPGVQIHQIMPCPRTS
jgi:hypothetical protein